MIQIISSIVLIGLLSFINRLRGAGKQWIKAIAWIPVGTRIRATILYGIVVSLFAMINDKLAVNSFDVLVYFGFDISLMLISMVSFFVWAVFGWGEYMDSGGWQRRFAPNKEVGFIDSIIDMAAKMFPKTFISTKEWNPEKWDTLHRHSDVLGMTLRGVIFAVPAFVAYSVYFNNYFIVLLSLMFLPIGFIYLYWSIASFNEDKSWYKEDKLGGAEWTTGAVCWGLSIVLMFYMV